MAISKLVLKYSHLKSIGITDGSSCSYLYHYCEIVEICLKEDNWPVVNSIGSGDTASVLWLHYRQNNIQEPEAFISSLAAARASCLSITPGEFDFDVADSIKSKMYIREVGR